jgi:hypothetical protein
MNFLLRKPCKKKNLVLKPGTIPVKSKGGYYG